MSAYANDVLLTNHAFGAFCRIARRMPGAIPQINRLVTRLAGRSERVERSASIFASPRLVRFTEMEYALPRARTPEAVRRVIEMIESRGLAVPFPIEVRTVGTRRRLPLDGRRARDGYVAVHMFAGMQWRDYFERVEAIMDRARRAPALGQAPLPDGSHAAWALPRLGPLPGGARAPGPNGCVHECLDRSRAWAGERVSTTGTPSAGTAASAGAGPTTPARPLTPGQAYERLERATAGLQAPFALSTLTR